MTAIRDGAKGGRYAKRNRNARRRYQSLPHVQADQAMYQAAVDACFPKRPAPPAEPRTHPQACPCPDCQGEAAALDEEPAAPTCDVKGCPGTDLLERAPLLRLCAFHANVHDTAEGASYRGGITTLRRAYGLKGE